MGEQNERTEDVERHGADAPAEGAVVPGQDDTETTPHTQDPAEGIDPAEPFQR